MANNAPRVATAKAAAGVDDGADAAAEAAAVNRVIRMYRTSRLRQYRSTQSHMKTMTPDRLRKRASANYSRKLPMKASHVKDGVDGVVAAAVAAATGSEMAMRRSAPPKMAPRRDCITRRTISTAR